MKVAALQLVSSVDADKNVETVSRLVKTAVEKKAELIVLPENPIIFGAKKPISDDDQWEHIILMSQLAQDYNVTIVGGTLPLSGHVLAELVSEYQYAKEHPLPYATTLVIDKEGECAGVYTKLHLLDTQSKEGGPPHTESNIYRPGETAIVFRNEAHYFGVAVSNDIRFPELFRFFVENNAKAICIPGAFNADTGYAHWEVLVRARAIETQSYVIAANQGGKHDNGQETSGKSMIVDPWGSVLAHITKGEGVITANIDFEYVNECRNAIPVIEKRRM